jgi:hypothetical protein
MIRSLRSRGRPKGRPYNFITFAGTYCCNEHGENYFSRDTILCYI